MRTVRIATRGSRLALWQASFVKGALERLGRAVDLVVLKTEGDRIQDRDLPRGADKGFFIKEIEQALVEGGADLAVHSLKDMPTRLPEGLALIAVPPRADVRDCLVARGGGRLMDLARGARVATGSLRRKAQLLHLRPDIEVAPLRGNVPTRIEKLDREGHTAIVLARAGLDRLGLASRATETFDPVRFLPAVGQGALGIEGRSDDDDMIALASRLEDRSARLGTAAERALLRALEGGCQVPVGAYGRQVGGRLRLMACVASLDGRTLVRDEAERPCGDEAAAEAIGCALAESLLAKGARAVLDEVRGGKA